jgi:hypothetical protein
MREFSLNEQIQLADVVVHGDTVVKDRFGGTPRLITQKGIATLKKIHEDRILVISEVPLVGVKGGATERGQPWGVWDREQERFVGATACCNGTFRDADGTARYFNERDRRYLTRYEARLMPTDEVLRERLCEHCHGEGTVRVFPNLPSAQGVTRRKRGPPRQRGSHELRRP